MCWDGDDGSLMRVMGLHLPGLPCLSPHLARYPRPSLFPNWTHCPGYISYYCSDLPRTQCSISSSWTLSRPSPCWAWDARWRTSLSLQRLGCFGTWCHMSAFLRSHNTSYRERQTLIGCRCWRLMASWAGDRTTGWTCYRPILTGSTHGQCCKITSGSKVESEKSNKNIIINKILKL